MVVAVEETTVV